MLSSQTWSQARNNCCTKLLPLHRLQAHTSWQLPNCEHHPPLLSPTAETALQAATGWWQQENSAFQTLSAAATRSFTQGWYPRVSALKQRWAGALIWLQDAFQHPQCSLGSYVQFEAPWGTGWLVFSLCSYLMVIPTAEACRYRVFHMRIIIINKYNWNSAFP